VKINQSSQSIKSTAVSVRIQRRKRNPGRSPRQQDRRSSEEYWLPPGGAKEPSELPQSEMRCQPPRSIPQNYHCGSSHLGETSHLIISGFSSHPGRILGAARTPMRVEPLEPVLARVLPPSMLFHGPRR
jgi:hypothetical protein